MKTDRLSIIDCGDYYTIINLAGNYDNHCHVKTEKTASMLKQLIQQKRVPKSDYLRDSALRVTINERYKENIIIKKQKDKQKQNYFNPNKGLKVNKR